jgi:hypothetical protein
MRCGIIRRVQGAVARSFSTALKSGLQSDQYSSGLFAYQSSLHISQLHLTEMGDALVPVPVLARVSRLLAAAPSYSHTPVFRSSSFETPAGGGGGRGGSRNSLSIAYHRL